MSHIANELFYESKLEAEIEQPEKFPRVTEHIMDWILGGNPSTFNTPLKPTLNSSNKEGDCDECGGYNYQHTRGCVKCE